MRHPRFVVSRFFTIGFTLCVGLLGSGRVYANPVYADERSLSNGAQLYELHCGECHGRISADQSGAPYETDETNLLSENSELIGTAPAKDSSQVPEVRVKDQWPAWAKRPDPAEVSKPDARAEVLNDVTAMIEKAHETASGRDASDNAGGNADLGDAGGFNPIPGATDLSDPQAYFYGTSEEELFNNIAKGTGAAMPGWRTRLENEEAIWDLVNYIRSFWSEEWLY